MGKAIQEQMSRTYLYTADVGHLLAPLSGWLGHGEDRTYTGRRESLGYSES